MERKVSESGSGILVQKEIRVHSDDDDGQLTDSQQPYVSTLVRSMSDLRRSNPVTHPEAEALRPLQLVNMLRHPDVDEERLGDLLGERRSEENLRHLIEFLRTTPPSTNAMATPDVYSSSSEDPRWRKLKVFRKKKRKTRRRRPPMIKLPDSAVAAKTTGGHRHIAISIPFQYSHLGPLSPSQYPIYESMTADFHREIEARLRTLHGLTPDHHIGTRLGPVAEDRESVSSAHASSKRSRSSPSPPRTERPKSKGKEKRSSTQSGKSGKSRKRSKSRDKRKSHQSVKSRFSEHRSSQHSVKYKPFPDEERGSSELTGGDERNSIIRARDEGTASRKAMAKAHSRNPSQVSATSSVYSATNKPTALTQAPTQPSPSVSSSAQAPTTQSAPLPVLPTRTSSKRTSTDRRESIDFLLGATPQQQQQLHAPRISTSSPSPPSGSNHNGGNSSNGAVSDSRRPLSSIAGSIMSTESVPRVMSAQSAKAYQNPPIVVRPSSRHQADVTEDSPMNFQFPRPPSQAITRTMQAEMASEGERPKSRKDRVRELRKRDMEKMKTMKQQQEEQSEQQEEAGPSKSSHLEPPPPLGERAVPESPVLGRFSRELTSPVLSTRTSAEQLQQQTKLKKKPKPIQVAEQTATETKMPVISPTDILEKSQRRLSQSPPSTASGSPPGSAWGDRTSMSRRRERREERDVQSARKAKYAAKALAEAKETTDRLSRQELVQRYENLKEVRIHEMEKRLRRLERNGDVWLRSMVPLMETVNRVLQEQQVLQREANYSYPAVPPSTTSAAPPPIVHHSHHSHMHVPAPRIPSKSARRSQRRRQYEYAADEVEAAARAEAAALATEEGYLPEEEEPRLSYRRRVPSSRSRQRTSRSRQRTSRSRQRTSRTRQPTTRSRQTSTAAALRRRPGSSSSHYSLSGGLGALRSSSMAAAPAPFISSGFTSNPYQDSDPSDFPLRITTPSTALTTIPRSSPPQIRAKHGSSGSGGQIKRASRPPSLRLTGREEEEETPMAETELAAEAAAPQQMGQLPSGEASTSAAPASPPRQKQQERQQLPTAADFEQDKAHRRAAELRQDRLDERMRRAEEALDRMSRMRGADPRMMQEAQKRYSFSASSASPSPTTSASSSPTESQFGVEPVMRELQRNAARLSAQSVASGGSFILPGRRAREEEERRESRRREEGERGRREWEERRREQELREQEEEEEREREREREKQRAREREQERVRQKELRDREEEEKRGRERIRTRTRRLSRMGESEVFALF